MKFTGKREPALLSTLSSVELLDVFTGDKSLIGKTVSVYECGYFIPKDNAYRIHSHVQNLMTFGDEYLFTGKVITNPYKKEEDIKLTIDNRGEGYFGFHLLRIRENTDVLLDPELVKNKAIKYGDILDNEFICANQAQLDAFVSFKKACLEMYIK